MEARIEVLEPDVTEIKVEVATIKATYVLSHQFAESQQRVARIEITLEHMYSELENIKMEIRSMKADIHSMKEEIAGLKAEVATLRREVEQLKREFAKLSEEMQKINGSLSSLDARFYKFEARMKTWMLTNTLALVAMQAAMLGYLALR